MKEKLQDHFLHGKGKGNKDAEVLAARTEPPVLQDTEMGRRRKRPMPRDRAEDDGPLITFLNWQCKGSGPGSPPASTETSAASA